MLAFCSQCGTAVPPKAAVCSNCGRRLRGRAGRRIGQALRIGLLTLTGVLVIGWVASSGPPPGHALPPAVVPTATHGRVHASAARPPLPEQPRPSVARAIAAPPTEPLPPRERSVALGPSSVAIPAGSYSFVAFTVAPGLLNPTVRGLVAAHGGGGNDIQVWVLDAAQFASFQAHRLTRAYYDSSRVAAVTVSVGPLPPGSYDVVFSNVFSLFTAKQVTNSLRLTYQENR